MSDSALDLARPELLDRVPYKPPVVPAHLVRLHANESPWQPPGDHQTDGLNRYPSLSAELESLMSHVYGVSPDQVLATRGSNDAIDLLVRGFCRAGIDAILTATPTFAMYGELAAVQGAAVESVPLEAEGGFRLDVDTLMSVWQPQVKIVFVCSPNNPTGTTVPCQDVERLLAALDGRSLVVVDEAYVEFASTASLAPLIERWANLVVVRTLSKAYGLAGARCGALLARADIVRLMRGILPPYALGDPAAGAALAALQPRARRQAARHFARIGVERGRVARALAVLPSVLRVWPSEANFVLVETTDPDAFEADCRAGGVLVRRVHGSGALARCVRVTIGAPEDNDRLLSALDRSAGARPASGVRS